MTHSDIEGFLAVVETGSLSRAAKQLFISQPAMSHRIQSLEAEVGVQLFVRKKGVRKIELTEAGKEFIVVANRWQKLWAETKNIKNIKGIYNFKIAALNYINIVIMPETYHRFIMRNLEITLSISTLSHSDKAYSLIMNNDIDMALIANPMYSRNIDNIPIFKEKMKMIYSIKKDFPDIVHPSELDDSEEIVIDWSNEFKSWHEYWFGSLAKQRIFIDNIVLLERLVIDIGGWAIIPASMANYIKENPLIKTCDVKEGPPDRVYYLLSRQTEKHKYIKEIFLEDLKTVIQNNEQIELL